MQKKLPKMTAEAMDAASAEDIVPRLRSKSWLAAVRKQVPEEQLPMHEPLAGEVLVTYAFDLPEHFVLVSPPRLQRLGLAAHDLRATAVQNMKSRLGKVAVRDLDLFYAVEVQNDLEACVVLLDNFWAQVEGGMIEGDIIAATPCRNGLLFCSADSE
jgi:uncharacterized protein YtpQ (UPF0354 family)